MRFPTVRLALVATITVGGVVLAACPPAPSEGEGEGEGEGGCGSDRDCLGGSICDKTNDGDDIPAADDESGVCVKIACTSDADCADDEKCDLRRGICVPENLCDPGDPDACGAGAAERCIYTGGLPQCVTPPAPADCIVTPAQGFMSVGGTLQLEAVGINDAGKLVPHATFTFSGTDVSATGVLTPAAAGSVTVTATSTADANVTCTATVTVYPAVGANDLRITLIDQATRTPIAGAPVAAKIAGIDEEGATGADGSFTFVGGAAATAVSAFPPRHQWHTILEPGQDIVIYTSAIDAGAKVDGIKGGFDFSKVHTKGDIRLGLAGTAINAAITDLNFSTIIGEFVPTTIDIEGITDPGGQEVELPEGLVIGLGDENFKGQYAALSDHAGPGIGWALGGQVALSKVGPIISNVAGSAEDINAGAILGAILPFFATFDHAIVTGLDFELAARTEGDPNFETVTLTPDTLLALSAEYDMPDLPCAPGGFSGGADRCGNELFKVTFADGTTAIVNTCAGVPADATCEAVSSFASGAVVLTGVLVPGQGLVPLGISAALDDADGDNSDEFDGVPEQSGDNAPDAGKLLLDYAPPHDGIEGSIYVTVAIALDINAITSTEDLGASIITQVSRGLPATGNTFAGNDFLESQGGTFVPGAAGSFALSKKGDADFYRVNLDNGAEEEWNVWFDGDNSGTFNIADLPQHADVDVTPRTAHADVQAFALGAGYDGPSPADFAQLFAFDGRDLDNLLYYLGGWSSESCKPNGLCSEN